MISVLLVDDHELVRTGVRRLLEDTSGMEVIGEAGTGEEALESVKNRRPDVVLMDVNMPGIGGLEATRKLVQMDPDLRVIVCTVHDHEPFPSRLLEAGAAGYLTKDCAFAEIVRAIRVVYSGERYISAGIAQSLALSSMAGSAGSPFERLSAREMQVMLMFTQGHSVQIISDRLCLSPKTVSTYRYRLFEKLGVFNDIELLRLAMRHGVIEGSEPA